MINWKAGFARLYMAFLAAWVVLVVTLMRHHNWSPAAFVFVVCIPLSVLLVGLLARWVLRGFVDSSPSGPLVQPTRSDHTDCAEDIRAFEQKAAGEVPLLLLVEPFLHSWRTALISSEAMTNVDIDTPSILSLADLTMPYYQCGLFLAEFAKLHGSEAAGHARHSLAVRIEVLGGPSARKTFEWFGTLSNIAKDAHSKMQGKALMQLLGEEGDQMAEYEYMLAEAVLNHSSKIPGGFASPEDHIHAGHETVGRLATCFLSARANALPVFQLLLTLLKGGRIAALGGDELAWELDVESIHSLWRGTFPDK
jgi:hypothetical protein